MINKFPTDIKCDTKQPRPIGFDFEEVNGKVNFVIYLSDNSKMAYADANIFIKDGAIQKVELGKMKQVIEIF